MMTGNYIHTYVILVITFAKIMYTMSYIQSYIQALIFTHYDMYTETRK